MTLSNLYYLIVSLQLETENLSDRSNNISVSTGLQNVMDRYGSDQKEIRYNGNIVLVLCKDRSSWFACTMKTLVLAVAKEFRLDIFNEYEPFNFNFGFANTLAITTNLTIWLEAVVQRCSV